MAVISLLGVMATAVFPSFFSPADQANRSSEGAVVGSVQTGVYLYGNESLVLGRSPPYPLTLDEATPGISAPTNPLFVAVLENPITRDWSKEGPLAYEGPTGRQYVYDPDRGTFVPSETEDSEISPPPDPLGEILGTFGNILFYNSGAIVDTSTSLAYVPDYSSETVELTLVSGTQVITYGDGSATIVLPDGREFYVPDINGREASYRVARGGGEPDLYVAVGQGQAREWENGLTTLSRSSSYDARTRTYSAETAYRMDGRYAGGSLSPETGFIYETTYQSEAPVTIRSRWTPVGKKGYRGSTETEYSYASDSAYASNAEQGARRQAYGVSSSTSGTSRTDYTYDARAGLYESHDSGSYGYQSTYRALNQDDRTFEDHLTYEGSLRQNQRNGNYEGSVRYRFRSGRDETYEYRYDARSRTYTSVSRNNNTGEERRHESRR